MAYKNWEKSDIKQLPHNEKSGDFINICNENAFFLPLPTMPFKPNWDALGISVSVACAIHCAILPLLLGSLPVFGVDLIQNQFFEYTMVGLAACIGLYSLWHGYKKHHHSQLPILVFMVGISLLVAKLGFPRYETLLLTLAVVFIISSHYMNYKRCRIHNHAHQEDCNH
jgi:MerC mercury resistance protein